MIRIICPKCKNAYLQKADGNLTCPSCEAVFSEKDENQAHLRQGRGLFAKESGKEMKDLLPNFKIVLFVFFILSCLTVYIFCMLMVY